MSDRYRLRRSELSSPGTSPKMIAKAAASAADVAFIDLEDAVAASEKTVARRHAVAGLTELDWGRTGRAVRVNAVDTPWCHDDVIEVVTGAGRHLDVLIVPKVKAERDVWFVDDLLTQLELKLGLEVGRIGLEVIIEEAQALAWVREIARSSDRLEAMVLGMGDLAASQGMRLGHIGMAGGDSARASYPGDVWHHARTEMIVAARAAGIDAIDGPYAAFRDADGMDQAATTFAILGGGGKWCIHPSQIEVANRVFSPTPEEIAEAQAVVDAVHAAERAGEGAANLDGVMIDAATARLFELRLERARQCGLLEDSPETSSR